MFPLIEMCSLGTTISYYIPDISSWLCILHAFDRMSAECTSPDRPKYQFCGTVKPIWGITTAVYASQTKISGEMFTPRFSRDFPPNVFVWLALTAVVMPQISFTVPQNWPVKTGERGRCASFLYRTVARSDGLLTVSLSWRKSEYRQSLIYNCTHAHHNAFFPLMWVSAA